MTSTVLKPAGDAYVSVAKEGRKAHVTRAASTSLLLHGKRWKATVVSAQLKVKENVTEAKLTETLQEKCRGENLDKVSVQLLRLLSDPTGFSLRLVNPTAEVPSEEGLPEKASEGHQENVDQNNVVNKATDGLIANICSGVPEASQSLMQRLIAASAPLLASPAEPEVVYFVCGTANDSSYENSTIAVETVHVKRGHERSFVNNVQNVIPTLAEQLAGGHIAMWSSQKSPRIFYIRFAVPHRLLLQKMKQTDSWREWRKLLEDSLDGLTILREFRLTTALGTKAEAFREEQPDDLLRSEAPSVASEVSTVAGDAPSQLEVLLAADPRLAYFKSYLVARYQRFVAAARALVGGDVEEGAAPMAQVLATAEAYKTFGLHHEKRRDGTSGWRIREWLPAATEVFIRGEFNSWDKRSHPLEKEVSASGRDNGMWTAFIPDEGQCGMKHLSRCKLLVIRKDGQEQDRLSAWTHYVSRCVDTGICDMLSWSPSAPYEWQHAPPVPAAAPRVYEAHVGISSWETKVATFSEFREMVLPRIKRLGYNTLCLVGMQEHSNYASFGWHVTSPMAIPSRLGTPDELKALIDDAHEMGIAVWMSVNQSHVSPVEDDGIANLDGSNGCYVRSGQVGQHVQWDACIYSYETLEAQRYLLAHLAYFAAEYHFDGFRFEAVQSMLYTHHGVGRAFSPEQYDTYFNFELDEAAVTYLMMATTLCRVLGKRCIAVDESVLPTLCDPIEQGGMGFDFRMNNKPANAIWDFLAAERDEEFDLKRFGADIKGALCGGNTLVAAESWDQCLFARRPLKIAFFAWESLHTHAVGGVAPHVTELAAGLSRHGHEVHVFTRATGPNYVHSIHYGVHYHECPFTLNSDFVAEMANMCNSMAAHAQDSERYMADQFSVIHAHDWLAAQVTFPMKALGRTCVQTMHSTEFGRCGNKAYGGQSGRIRDIEHHGCAAADRVICVSGVLADEIKQFYSVNAEKIKVIYNGIEATNFDGFEDAAPIKAAYGINPLEPVLLFVGRMAVQKGPDLLVEAVPSILRFRSDVKILMVGDGHLMPDLRNRVQQLNVQHAVRFLGTKTGPQLRSLFKACDAVVVPSRNEPFGIVVLEAWSAYKPVVATTSGGPRDFVSPDVDGYLVDPQPGSIAWGCCEVLKNFDHTRWMGERGRVKAAFSFSWNTIAQQTRDVYFELMNKHDAPYAISSFSKKFGEGSLAFRLMGSSMFYSMSVFDNSDVVRRGLALHKMFRLVMAAVGKGYTNFMGNEFGHPEYVDMPRPGNNFTMHLARRRWDLADDTSLKFKHFEFFDAVLTRHSHYLAWQESPINPTQDISVDEEAKLLIIQRGRNLFLVNFHPTQAVCDYHVHLNDCDARSLKIVLATEEERFGGSGVKVQLPKAISSTTLSVHVPERSAVILTAESLTFEDPICKLQTADEFIETKSNGAVQLN